MRTSTVEPMLSWSSCALSGVTCSRSGATSTAAKRTSSSSNRLRWLRTRSVPRSRPPVFTAICRRSVSASSR
jgi:hypothetical protein